MELDPMVTQLLVNALIQDLDEETVTEEDIQAQLAKFREAIGMTGWPMAAQKLFLKLQQATLPIVAMRAEETAQSFQTVTPVVPMPSSTAQAQSQTEKGVNDIFLKQEPQSFRPEVKKAPTPPKVRDPEPQNPHVGGYLTSCFVCKRRLLVRGEYYNTDAFYSCDDCGSPFLQ